MSMQSIMSASMSLNHIQTMQSVRTKTQGQIGVLNAEIKQDGGDPIKEEKVRELEKSSASLTSNLTGELNDINETLKPENESPKPEDEATDKVELTKPSEGTQDNKEIRSETPALYDAAGNLKETAPLSDRQLDAKA